jgi:hypothetical protein
MKGQDGGADQQKLQSRGDLVIHDPENRPEEAKPAEPKPHTS